MAAPIDSSSWHRGSSAEGLVVTSPVFVVRLFLNPLGMACRIANICRSWHTEHVRLESSLYRRSASAKQHLRRAHSLRATPASITKSAKGASSPSQSAVAGLCSCYLIHAALKVIRKSCIASISIIWGLYQKLVLPVRAARSLLSLDVNP